MWTISLGRSMKNESLIPRGLINSLLCLIFVLEAETYILAADITTNGLSPLHFVTKLCWFVVSYLAGTLLSGWHAKAAVPLSGSEILVVKWGISPDIWSVTFVVSPILTLLHISSSTHNWTTGVQALCRSSNWYISKITSIGSNMGPWRIQWYITWGWYSGQRINEAGWSNTTLFATHFWC